VIGSVYARRLGVAALGCRILFSVLLMGVVLGSSSYAAPLALPAPRIVFSGAAVYEDGTYDWQLYSAAPSGREVAQLTVGVPPATKPLPSPDGRFIAFSHASELWVMRPDGRGAQRLLRYGPNATWTPDSRRIVFEAADGIRTIAATGGRSRLLVPAAARPTYSADGATMAFGRPFGGGMRVFLRRGGRDAPIATLVGGAGLELSPDGRWLAAATPAGLLLVFRVDGARARLVRQFGQAAYPAWSPTGDRLAFAVGRQLQVLNAVTGGLHAFDNNGPVYSVKALAWSPTGDEIAYAMGYQKEPSGFVEAVSLQGRVRRIALSAAIGVGDDLAWMSTPSKLENQPPVPLASVVGNELRLRHRADSIAADGDRVAYDLCNAVGAWRPAGGEVTTVRMQLPLCGYDSTLFVYDIALADDRVAWASLQGGNSKSGWLTVAPLTLNAPQTVVSAPRSRTSGDPRGNARSGYLMGDGRMLVFSEWSFCDDVGQPCIGIPVTDRRILSQSLWRVREPSWPESCPTAVPQPPYGSPVGSCQRLRTEPGPLTPLDVNEDRVLAAGDNAVVLIDSAGKELLSVPVSASAGQLDGRNLLLVVAGQLRVYDASSGALVRTFDGPSTLQDAAKGLVAYLVGGQVSVMRLADGAVAAVGAGRQARFGDTGLYYAYDGEYPWRGRIRFVPFEELLLR
jgi:Tol biopolymer transport system component